MQHSRNALVLCLAVAIGACAEPLAPPDPLTVTGGTQLAAREGTGLVLESLTGLPELPLIGSVGEVDLDQAVITRLVIDEIAGSIVGLEAEGILTLSGGVLGNDIITEEFLTQVHVVSSGPGKCDVLRVELGPIALDALGEGIFLQVPDAEINARAVGAVGSLLCNVGSLLQGPVSGVTSAVRGLVNAINRLLL